MGKKRKNNPNYMLKIGENGRKYWGKKPNVSAATKSSLIKPTIDFHDLPVYQTTLMKPKYVSQCFFRVLDANDLNSLEILAENMGFDAIGLNQTEIIEEFDRQGYELFVDEQIAGIREKVSDPELPAEKWEEIDNKQFVTSSDWNVSITMSGDSNTSNVFMVRENIDGSEPEIVRHSKYHNVVFSSREDAQKFQYEGGFLKQYKPDNHKNSLFRELIEIQA